MRSRDADRFNHDPWAEDYDERVLDETNPIRAGYAALLAWTVEEARIDADSVVLDLGVGTGNTSALIPAARRLVGIDVSAKMIEQAAAKLAHRSDVELVQADLLEFFDRDLPDFDAVVSTYSVHHLDADEKAELFRRVRAVLRPGGRAVFGDLMFESEAARSAIAAEWSDAERAQVLVSVEEEHPWRLDRAVRDLAAAGLAPYATKRFSTLSWGVACERAATAGDAVAPRARR